MRSYTSNMVREIGDATQSLQLKDLPKDPLTRLLVGPFLIWLVFLGPVRGMSFVFRRKWESMPGMNYVDVTNEVARVHRHWFLSRIVTPIALICAVSSLSGILLAQSVAVLFGFVVSAGVFISARLLTRSGRWGHSSFSAKLAGGRRKRTGWTARNNSRPLLSSATAFAGYTLLVGATGLYLLAGIAAMVLADGSSRYEIIYALFKTNSDSLLDDSRLALSAAVIGLQYSPELGFAIFFAPIVVLAVLFLRLCRRLSAPSAVDEIAASGGHYILYLRGFDEDKLRIPSPSLRSGLAERITPLRKRNFEEVLVAALNAFGPVVALAHPQSRLPPLGAAKNVIRNDFWFEHVKELAANADCVVVSGTPAAVREGLGMELDFIGSGRVPRVVIVQAPWSKKKLAKRWTTFRAYICDMRFFADLCEDIWPPGAHVFARTNCRSWEGWEMSGPNRYLVPPCTRAGVQSSQGRPGINRHGESCRSARRCWRESLARAP